MHRAKSIIESEFVQNNDIELYTKFGTTQIVLKFIVFQKVRVKSVPFAQFFKVFPCFQSEKVETIIFEPLDI